MGGIFSTENNAELSEQEASEESESIEDEDTDSAPKKLGADVIELEHLSMKYKLAGDEEVECSILASVCRG